MRTVLKILAAACVFAAASLALSPTEARAETAYPWCAISSMSMGLQTCSFASLDQCRAFVTSMGFCQPDARYTAPVKKPRRP